MYIHEYSPPTSQNKQARRTHKDKGQGEADIIMDMSRTSGEVSDILYEERATVGPCCMSCPFPGSVDVQYLIILVRAEV